MLVTAERRDPRLPVLPGGDLLARALHLHRGRGDPRQHARARGGAAQGRWCRDLLNLHDVYRALLKARDKRGAIDFETTETQIVCDENGRIEKIVPRTRNEAHKLIEEAMLAANVCSADFIARAKHPALYRVHEGPTPEKKTLLQNYLKALGLGLSISDDPKPAEFQAIAAATKDRPDAPQIHTMLLRSMQQAIYTPINSGHFGLAYEAYTHFTSPIRRSCPAAVEPPAPARREPRVIEVSGLTVRFGGVTPIDDMGVVFEAGTCGLIGPNGAGKTTFFNVMSGFVKPAAGTYRLRREPAEDGRLPPGALGPSPHVPNRDGDREAFGLRQRRDDPRAFGREARTRRADVLTAIEFVGLEVTPKTKVGGLSARERRLVEVARAVVGHPRLVLLDEPAAGLPDEETGTSASDPEDPGEFGALAILVDHDMSLVSACCETTAVIDFGKLIASGPTPMVLRDEHVMRAYLGTEEEL